MCVFFCNFFLFYLSLIQIFFHIYLFFFLKYLFFSLGKYSSQKAVGPWGALDNFRVNHKTERKFELILPENTKNENKNVTVIVKYLSEDSYNVKINGLTEGNVIEFENVKVKLSGENDIELDIEFHSIFKAKFYANNDGNVRVLKKDGSITNIVNKIILKLL